jgi:hypothetical protein
MRDFFLAEGAKKLRPRRNVLQKNPANSGIIAETGNKFIFARQQ